MKTKILDIKGTEKGTIDLPKEFSIKVREDIVAKVLEAKKRHQPYSPSPVAGKQHSAKGKMVHRRHVWRSGYGRGGSRVPRKIFSQRGSHFNWEAAEVPQARGGMRAHPPKVLHFQTESKINKKELKVAFASALSATANEKYVLGKYSSLDKLDTKIPLVVSSFEKIKVKDLLIGLKKILGEEMYNVAIKKKSIRAGKGTMRGRKYKSNAGMLLVIGNDEKVKTKMIEVKQVNELGIVDLAKGGLGRLTVYTEKAVKNLDERLNKIGDTLKGTGKKE
jgi:large subunit ribosomal protein L4e